MSQDEALSRKEKKAQRDADRRKSGKKRKHEHVEDEQITQVADVAVDQLQKDFIPLAAESEAVDEHKSTKSKSKKRKLDAEEVTEDAADAATPKPKKRRKKTKTAADSTDGDAPADGDTSNTKPRFVVFIGNLPYKTTDTSLQTHFQKLQPFTLRHRLDPKTQKSKGFAFLEFENYDRMKTCLKLYHHSIFDPDDVKAEIEHGTEGSGANAEAPRGSKKKKAARRINVELTAGGGGKNAGRKEKIKVKNERLNGQRQRRAVFERAEKEKEEQEGPEKGKRTEGGKVLDMEKRKRNDKAKDPEKKKRKESVKDVLMAQVEERDAGGGAEKKKRKESVKDVPVAPVVDHNAGMHPSRLARLGV